MQIIESPVFITVLAVAIAMATAGAQAQDDPWADEVLEVNANEPNAGFDLPQETIGKPTGGGTFYPDNSGVHSVGIPASHIVLKFDTPVTDDPANPMGLDCIVFGNASWVGGNPLLKWMEAGAIEISQDVNGNGQADDPWYFIPGSRDLDSSVLPNGISNPSPSLAGHVKNPNAADADLGNDDEEYDWGYFDLTPAQREYLDNYVRPDDPTSVGLTARSGGGDAFDIAWARDSAGLPAGISQFDFIRLSALVQAYAGPFGNVTPELDAVADVAPDVDTDGDGILDEYEMRVSGTDPARPESTVLPLEIPSEDGGSPAGALLGVAADDGGNAIRFYSEGPRFTEDKNRNCAVDILQPGDPGGSIPGLLKSGTVREFVSDQVDFQAAEIQDAEFVMAYSAPEIIGLDEPLLEPYRYDGGGYTQDGILAITIDSGENQVTFRSQFPGVFVLASVAGAGDTGGDTGQAVLTADPASGIPADGTSVVTIASGTLLYGDASPVPDGTHFTITTTLGVITTADEDPGRLGTQVAVLGGAISFGLQAETQAGTAVIVAAAVDGTVNGTLNYPLLPGVPIGPVTIHLLSPEIPAPGPFDFTTDVIFDAHGNTVSDGTHLTLVVDGGEVTTSDAASGTAGHQVAANNGVATFRVRASDGKADAVLMVSLYADSGLTSLLGAETFTFEFLPVPLHVTGPVFLLLGLALIRRMKK